MGDGRRDVLLLFSRLRVTDDELDLHVFRDGVPAAHPCRHGVRRRTLMENHFVVGNAAPCASDTACSKGEKNCLKITIEGGEITDNAR